MVRAVRLTGLETYHEAMRTRRDDNETPVYSSDQGRRLPPKVVDDEATGGAVRVSRTSAGRSGKTVTLVTGVPTSDLAALAKELKRLCGSGGAVKAETIEIQGDHRAKVCEALTDRYAVKLAGG